MRPKLRHVPAVVSGSAKREDIMNDKIFWERENYSFYHSKFDFPHEKQSR